MSDDRIEKLASHFYKLYDRTPAHGVMTWSDQAETVLADPQAHIDALCEAGVLSMGTNRGGDYYRVLQPHVHEWRVEVVGAKEPDAPGGDTIYLGCATCRAVSSKAANRLPIEVPE